MNQQTFSTSPSIPNDILNIQRKPRGLSDVQAKVAFLNNLSRAGSPGASAPQAAAGNSAALQRAILGREEAESALAKVSTQFSEAQSRERRISERLESLLEELQSAKERRAHERTLFEKEIRKARKEAFRAGSTLVKVQEELKQARSEAKASKDEAQSEREAKEKAKQESFERAYTLAGLMEEMEVLKGRLRTAEAKNHAGTLEARAQEMRKEDIGRISLAEGDLAFLMTPTPRRPKRSAEESDDTPIADCSNSSIAQDTPPKRPRVSDVTPRTDKQDVELPDEAEDKVKKLEYNLKHERRLRTDAEGMIEFLRVECMFRRCTCRLEEEREKSHKHDTQDNKAKVSEEPGDNVEDNRNTEPQVEFSSQSPENSSDQPPEPAQSPEAEDQKLSADTIITFSPVTGTFRSVPSPVRRSPTKNPEHDVLEAQNNANNQSTSQLQVNSPLAKYERTRQETSFETVLETEGRSPLFTSGSRPSPVIRDLPWASELPDHHIFEENVDHYDSVKRIPLRNEEVESDRLFGVPGTPIDREDALAQIRARRGRTGTMKRSVSATESTLRAGGMGVTPVRATRRIPAVQNADGRHSDLRGRRDLSAPIRMFHR
ncbi:hypothetical protein BBP40_011732 [Aspergillus hancockii]|nr:hypothetical protein BBP40_011732 [Aspergillus hancockii]